MVPSGVTQTFPFPWFFRSLASRLMPFRASPSLRLISSARNFGRLSMKPMMMRRSLSAFSLRIVP